MSDEAREAFQSRVLEEGVVPLVVVLVAESSPGGLQLGAPVLPEAATLPADTWVVVPWTIGVSDERRLGAER